MPVEPHTRPSRKVLDTLPMRAVAFLRGVATHRDVRLALQTVGYDVRTHDEGLALLVAVLAAGAPVDAEARAIAERPRAALASLDATLHAHGPRLAAAVRRALPHEEAFAALFFAAPAGDPAASAVALTRVLEALDAREPEDPLVRLLAARGFDEPLRSELRIHLADAQRLAPIEADVALGASVVREKELLALYTWHREWTTAARAVIARGDWRMRLGIGDTRRGLDEGAE